MKITKNTNYGLIFLKELASNFSQKKPIATSEVAKHYQIPEAYLRKIASQLRKKKIIKAKEGREGGYLLSQPPDTISLYDVLDILESELLVSPCQFCHLRQGECGFDNFWQEINVDLEQYFKNIKLSDLWKFI